MRAVVFILAIAACLTAPLCAQTLESLSPDELLTHVPASAEAEFDFEQLEAAPQDGVWIDAPGHDQYLDVQVDQPWCQERPLGRLFAPSDGRSRGRGNPLTRESWLNRPFSVGFFSGGFMGDQLLQGQVNGSTGYFLGLRAGYDGSHFWGLETRIGASDYSVSNIANNAPLGNNDVFVWDTSLMWYPWGDAQWRPYATVGLGLANVDFYNVQQQHINETVFATPFGGGVKYRYNSRWVMRFDVVDNLIYGAAGQFNTTHNLSLTGAIETRFGAGSSRSYWPWNPSRALR